MKFLVAIILIGLWIYLLLVCKRANLNAWRFLLGSAGLFVIMMIFVRPLFTDPLAKAVAAIAGLVGNATHTFSPYFRYGILFVDSMKGTMTLQIDFECSGIIEIMAFISLLVFFTVYDVRERIILSIIGTGIMLLANSLRIIVICEMIYFGGTELYAAAHTFVGRLVFYLISVLLYFYVFTKPQIVRMKVGMFKYGA